jgi:hypothetical protein
MQYQDENVYEQMYRIAAHEAGHTLAHLVLFENVESLSISVDPSAPRAHICASRQSSLNPWVADINAVALVAGIVGETYAEDRDPMQCWSVDGPTAGDFAAYQLLADKCLLRLPQHMAIATALIVEFEDLWEQIRSDVANWLPDEQQKFFMGLQHSSGFFEFKHRYFGQLPTDAEKAGAGRPKVKTDDESAIVPSTEDDTTATPNDEN